jgi:nitroreductase
VDEVLRVVTQRRSIREFENREVPAEVVEKLAQALIWAPSAGNLQSRKFFFVTDGKLKELLALAALDQSFIARAPLVVVGCTDERIGQHYGARGAELYTIQDVACSIMSMMLVACENGLGTVWVGAFREKEVARALQLPAHLRPVAIVPVGYHASRPKAPTRVPLSEAVEFR